MIAMLSRTTLTLLLCVLAAGVADADPFRRRNKQIPEGQDPPREPKVVWPEIVNDWNAFMEIYGAGDASALDGPTLEKLDAALARIVDRLVELNLGLLTSDVTRNWIPRKRLSLEQGVKFLWADLAPLRIAVYRQVPGAVPALVKPVEITLWALQERFPEGYLDAEPRFGRPPDLPYDPDKVGTAS
jgi:hypothetical protein